MPSSHFLSRGVFARAFVMSTSPLANAPIPQTNTSPPREYLDPVNPLEINHLTLRPSGRQNAFYIDVRYSVTR
jgi:hypothetical protein